MNRSSEPHQHHLKRSVPFQLFLRLPASILTLATAKHFPSPLRACTLPAAPHLALLRAPARRRPAPARRRPAPARHRPRLRRPALLRPRLRRRHPGAAKGCAVLRCAVLCCAVQWQCLCCDDLSCLAMVHCSTWGSFAVYRLYTVTAPSCCAAPARLRPRLRRRPHLHRECAAPCSSWLFGGAHSSKPHGVHRLEEQRTTVLQSCMLIPTKLPGRCECPSQPPRHTHPPHWQATLVHRQRRPKLTQSQHLLPDPLLGGPQPGELHLGKMWACSRWHALALAAPHHALSSPAHRYACAAGSPDAITAATRGLKFEPTSGYLFLGERHACPYGGRRHVPLVLSLCSVRPAMAGGTPVLWREEVG